MDMSPGPLSKAMDLALRILDFRALDRTLVELDGQKAGPGHAMALFALSGAVLLLIGVLSASMSIYLTKMMGLGPDDPVPDYDPIPPELPLGLPIALTLIWLSLWLLPEGLSFLLMRRIGGGAAFHRQLYLSGALALSGALISPVLLLSFLPCLGAIPALGYMAASLYLIAYARGKAYSLVHGIPFVHALAVACGAFLLAMALSVPLNQLAMDAFNITIPE